MHCFYELKCRIFSKNKHKAIVFVKEKRAEGGLLLNKNLKSEIITGNHYIFIKD